MTEHTHRSMESLRAPAAASPPIHGKRSDDAPLTVAFALHEDDPFAVSMVIDQGDEKKVDWWFDRDLLTGVFDPATAGRVGVGDVRVEFDLDDVAFHLTGPDGSGTLKLPADAVARFVRLMAEELPLDRAAELRAFELDTLLGRWLWGAA